jgi:murein L,D-transpeptidase YcbB/YkuD
MSPVSVLIVALWVGSTAVATAQDQAGSSAASPATKDVTWPGDKSAQSGAAVTEEYLKPTVKTPANAASGSSAPSKAPQSPVPKPQGATSAALPAGAQGDTPAVSAPPDPSPTDDPGVTSTGEPDAGAPASANTPAAPLSPATAQTTAPSAPDGAASAPAAKNPPPSPATASTESAEPPAPSPPDASTPPAPAEIPATTASPTPAPIPPAAIPTKTESPEPVGPASAAPQTASPPTPAEGAAPTGPQVPAATAVPQAPAPSIADLIKSAVDALVNTQTQGRQAAEMHKERAAIAAYYAARDYAPLWIENGKPTDAVAIVMGQLAHAADDGLDLTDMPAPVFEGGEDKLAAADVALSAEIVAYGREASGSRVDPQEISGLIGAKPDLPDPALILAAVVAAGADGGTILQSFNPPQKAYAALREKLAELRSLEKSAASGPIPTGPTLRVGMSDPRVPLIRARFGLGTEQGGDGSAGLVYDTQVAAAVADFQKANGLPASGVLTARTIARLAQPLRLDNEIIANMERWRWMPREMGANRIEVNIPDFMATLVQNGEVVAHHKVIVGKPDTPTPVFSNAIKFLIVNPYWNVPPSIVRKEMLPLEEQDPTYLSRMGFEVYMQHGRLVVRQPPGERNALGLIKFMFPNQYSVYLHDTPTRGLFAAKRRAFSHGCVRVEQPFELAESLLGPAWPEARIKRLIGGAERYVYLPKPLPIHIEYFTAYVDDAGRLQLRDDLYGYSRQVQLALGLDVGSKIRGAHY